MRELVDATGRPLSMTVQQPEPLPDRWREMSAWVAEMSGRRPAVKTQMAARPIGVLLGLTATLNPWSCARASGGRRPAARRAGRRAGRSRSPARIIGEHARPHRSRLLGELTGGFHKLFPMADPVDYEPRTGLDRRRAAAAGRDPVELVLDLLLERDGHQLLYMPLFNYARATSTRARDAAARHMLIGSRDAGAHCGAICDASFPTTALALWASDGTRGRTLPLELLVHHLTQRTAHTSAGTIAVSSPRLPRRCQRHRLRLAGGAPADDRARPACRRASADADRVGLPGDHQAGGHDLRRRRAHR